MKMRLGAEGVSMSTAQYGHECSKINCCAQNQHMLHKYWVLSCAGQAVVQFAHGAADNRCYALKFYLSQQSFNAERNAYNDSILRGLLPIHFGIYDSMNQNSNLTDAIGNPLPSCIVHERGENLREWSQRRRPDIWEVVSVSAAERS